MKNGNLPTMHLFAEIKRTDDENRIVEGYCFVNEEVGDGYKLTRSAMEEASEGYMQFPAIREMHGKNAAGLAEAITWDDKGCMIRTKIVDDAAWEKVKAGVYRGFSVGVNPKVVRGKEVLAVDWVENSLVDRPKDPDAQFNIMRADDLAGDTQCVELEDGDTLRSLAARAATVGRLDEIQAELTRAKESNESLTAEVERLKKLADPSQNKPVLHTGGGNPGNEPQKSKREELQEELQELTRADYTDKSEADKQAAFSRVQAIRNELGV
jgi:hypothetical protein